MKIYVGDSSKIRGYVAPFIKSRIDFMNLSVQVNK